MVLLQNLPRAIPLKGVLTGRMREKMIGNVGCEAILSERGKLGIRGGEREGRSVGKSCRNQDFWLLENCHLSADNGQNPQTNGSS